MFFAFGARKTEKGTTGGSSLSRKNMLGLGKLMIKRKMKDANVASLEHMLEDFVEPGGKILDCDMNVEECG